MGDKSTKMSPVEMNGQLGKILFFAPTPPPYSGPESVTEMLLHSDLGKNFRISHIRANFNPVNASKGKLNRHNLLAGLRLFPALAHRMISDRPNILYTIISENRLGLLRNALVVTLANIFGVKVILHLHGSNFRSYYQHSVYFDRLVAKYVCRKCHTFIVLANSLKDQFREVLPGGYRVSAVYNAVDAENLFPSVYSYDQLVRSRSMNERRLVVLFMGYHSANKGYFDLMAAIPEVEKACPFVEFVSAGEAVKRDSFKIYGNNPAVTIKEKRKLVDFGLHRNHAVGTVQGEEKSKLFREADVFVLPSYSEGMPIVVLEAMAAGLPVVTTPVGAISELFHDGSNGFLVNPGKPEEISKALVTLLTNESLREKIGRINYERARLEFNVNRMAYEMCSVFKDVINTSPK